MSAKKLSFVALVGLLLVTALMMAPGNADAAGHLWKAQYYNNIGLSGNPTVVRDDASIDFNWGLSGPVSGVRRDDFSVRWTRNVPLEPGRYRFTVRVDDGVRLWVNNQLIIDKWITQPLRSYTGEINLYGGSVPIRMEYFERTGYAEAHLSWARLTTLPSGVGTATVNGAYFLNVRTGPGANHLIVTNVARGAVLTLLGYRDAPGNWVMVALPNGTEGWVHAGYVQTSVPVNSLPVWTAQGGTVSQPGRVTATVATGYLNVRKGPGVDYAVITAVPHGTTMTLTHRNSAGNWVRATLNDGRQGWLHAGYIQSSAPISSLPIGK